MKASLITLSTALLLGSISSAFAASTVELTVKGLITPSACTPSLSNAVIDHGKISAKDIDQDRGKVFNNILTMRVNCDAQTLFALRGIDNRAASSSLPKVGYGLGLINDTQKIGYYTFEVREANADDTPVMPLESIDDGISWSDIDGAVWQQANLAGFGDRASGQWSPVAIKDLSSELHVQTRIAPARDLDLSNEVLIDGSATIEVKYL